MAISNRQTQTRILLVAGLIEALAAAFIVYGALSLSSGQTQYRSDSVGIDGNAPVPVYAAPTYAPAYRSTVRKQIIIKNSPGDRVYEEDDIFGW